MGRRPTKRTESAGAERLATPSCGSQSWLQAGFQPASRLWPFTELSRLVTWAGFILRRASARLSSTSSTVRGRCRSPRRSSRIGNGGLKGRLQAGLPATQNAKATRGLHMDASGLTSISTTQEFGDSSRRGQASLPGQAEWKYVLHRCHGPVQSGGAGGKVNFSRRA
jgi:hypothetical protein